MFSGCSLLISLPDISKWNTYNNSIYMKSIFSRCSSLIYRNPLSIRNFKFLNFFLFSGSWLSGFPKKELIIKQRIPYI